MAGQHGVANQEGVNKASSPEKLLRRERTGVLFLILILSLTAAHFIHDGWLFWDLLQRIAQAHQAPSSAAPVLYAPSAYRVALPATIALLQRIVPHAGGSTIRSGLDFCFLSAALWFAYLRAIAGFSCAEEERMERGVQIALTFLFCLLAVPWIVQYQRPETTPAALFLMLSLYLAGKQGWWPVAAVSGLAMLQAFARADVVLCLGIGLAAASLLPLDEPGAIQVRWQGSLCIVIAIAVQGYLQMVRFPHLRYVPGVPVIQLANNLHLHQWSNCLLAISPTWLALAWGRKRWRRFSLKRADAAAMIAAALYLPVWLTFGLGAEVRIYVPFLLALSPVAARSVAPVLGWTKTGQPRQPLYREQVSC